MRSALGRSAALLILALITGACTSAEGDGPVYDPDQLEYLVLTERPRGTVVSGEPRHRGLEEISYGDPERRERFEDAGFIDLFEATFVTSGQGDGPQGFLLTSRAYLFEDPLDGLAAIEETVRAEGEGLANLGVPVDGREGFGLRGALDRELPRGVLYAWRKGNVVLVLAAIAVDRVNEGTLIRLARSIDALEPPTRAP